MLKRNQKPKSNNYYIVSIQGGFSSEEVSIQEVKTLAEYSGPCTDRSHVHRPGGDGSKTLPNVLLLFFLQFSNLQRVNKKGPDLSGQAIVLFLVLRACFIHLGLPALTKLLCVPVNISLSIFTPLLPSIGSPMSISSWLF